MRIERKMIKSERAKMIAATDRRVKNELEEGESRAVNLQKSQPLKAKLTLL